MTRINTVEPSLLTDQHLLAEIRELPRGISYIEQCVAKGVIPVAPKEYTLGSGHVKFFWNKGAYLRDRQKDLVSEWKARGYSLSFDLEEWEERILRIPSQFKNTYYPSVIDKQNNISRLIERILGKPSFYKYYGKPVSAEYLYGGFSL